jgi:hypothetical protein
MAEDESGSAEDIVASSPGDRDPLLEEMRAIRQVLERMLDVLVAWRPAATDQGDDADDQAMEPVVAIVEEVAVPARGASPAKGPKKGKRQKGRKG